MGFYQWGWIKIKQGNSQSQDEKCKKSWPSTIIEESFGQYSKLNKFVERADKDFQKERNLWLLRYLMIFWNFDQIT